MIKVAQFQKGFQFVSNLKNKVPYHSRTVLRTVIWHFCLEIWAKMKNFLRLIHLQANGIDRRDGVTQA